MEHRRRGSRRHVLVFVVAVVALFASGCFEEKAELFAAATVDVTNVQTSVGPLESVTQLGVGHYRVAFSEDAFGDIAPLTTAFISLTSNSAIDTPTPCFYEIVDSRTMDVRCYDLGSMGDEQPEDAEWSLMVYQKTADLPTP